MHIMGDEAKRWTYLNRCTTLGLVLHVVMAILTVAVTAELSVREALAIPATSVRKEKSDKES